MQVWWTREFYYINRRGDRVGPLELSTLAELYAFGKVTAQTEVWSPGGMWGGSTFFQLRETQFYKLVRRLAAAHCPGSASSLTRAERVERSLQLARCSADEDTLVNVEPSTVERETAVRPVVLTKSEEVSGDGQPSLSLTPRLLTYALTHSQYHSLTLFLPVFLIESD